MRTKIHDLAIAGDDDELSEFLEGHEEQKKRINEVCAPPMVYNMLALASRCVPNSFCAIGLCPAALLSARHSRTPSVGRRFIGLAPRVTRRK